MSLAEFQDAFAAALLSPELSEQLLQDIPHTSQGSTLRSQIEVYKKRSLEGFCDALEQVYPTVLRIMGKDAFTFIARDYLVQYPPSSPNHVQLGEHFAAHIEASKNDTSPPYLADIATLDFGRYQCEQASDMEGVSPSVFTELSPEMLATRKMQLQPACLWMSSPYAIYEIWQHFQDAPLSATIQFDTGQPQDVVILRSQLTAEIKKVSRGLVRVLDVLDDGETLSTALQQGAQEDPNMNPSLALQFIIEHHLVVSLF